MPRRPRRFERRLLTSSSPAALTFRVWVIGGGLSLVLACINSFLYYRNPAPQVPSTLGL